MLLASYMCLASCLQVIPSQRELYMLSPAAKPHTFPGCLVIGGRRPFTLIMNMSLLRTDFGGAEISLSRITPENLQRNFQINAFGPILVNKAFWPLMAKASSSEYAHPLLPHSSRCLPGTSFES